MSTLLVALEFPPDSRDGISSWTWDLAWALHHSGDKVTVLAKKSPGAKEADALLPFTVLRMRGRSWGNWQDVWARIAGGKLLKDHHRVIFSTWRLAALLGPVARTSGCLVGIAAHGSDLTRLKTRESGLDRADQSAHCWLPVSEFLNSELHRLEVESPSTVLPMPLPTHHSVVPHADRSGLLMLARLTSLKGLDRAITLANALDQPLTIVGDGPARANAEADASGRVRFLGTQPREIAMKHLCQALAIVLLPRTDEDGGGAEGLGLCLLEAAARGVPAIGCATGGIPEAVGPGLLIQPENPDLDSIHAFLSDPKAGTRAQAWVQTHHGPEACLQILREALE